MTLFHPGLGSSERLWCYFKDLTHTVLSNKHTNVTWEVVASAVGQTLPGAAIPAQAQGTSGREILPGCYIDEETEVRKSILPQAESAI